MRCLPRGMGYLIFRVVRRWRTNKRIWLVIDEAGDYQLLP